MRAGLPSSTSSKSRPSESTRLGRRPLFTLITGPSAEQHEVGEKKKQVADRHDARNRFFTGLLEKAAQRTSLHANVSPPAKAGWVGTSAGRSGIDYNYVVLKDGGRVELYIDFDQSEGGAGNKAVFDALHAQREAVEAAYGGPLEWERLDDGRASRISASVLGGGWKDEPSWPTFQDTMVDAMVKFDAVLRPRLKVCLNQ
jgi:hypothetical protein